MKNKLIQLILACMLAMSLSPIAHAESEDELNEAVISCQQDTECSREVRKHKAKLKASSDKAEAEWKNNTVEKAFNVLSIPALIIGLLYYFFWVKPDREEKAKIKR